MIKRAEDRALEANQGKKQAETEIAKLNERFKQMETNQASVSYRLAKFDGFPPCRCKTRPRSG